MVERRFPDQICCVSQDAALFLAWKLGFEALKYWFPIRVLSCGHGPWLNVDFLIRFVVCRMTPPTLECWPSVGWPSISNFLTYLANENEWGGTHWPWSKWHINEVPLPLSVLTGWPSHDLCCYLLCLFLSLIHVHAPGPAIPIELPHATINTTRAIASMGLELMGHSWR